MNVNSIDSIDESILSIIKNNARLTYSEIGTRLNLSRVTIKNRMDEMERKEIIKGYTTIIDTTEDSGVTFFIDVEAVPEKYQDVINVLTSSKYLTQVYSTTGEARIHAIGHACNQNTMQTFVNYLFNHTEGIKKIGWHMVMSTIKDVDGGVAYERKQESDYSGNE